LRGKQLVNVPMETPPNAAPWFLYSFQPQGGFNENQPRRVAGSA
jgi:hypothetical protein